MAIRRAITEVVTVPEISAQMPYFLSAKRGVHSVSEMKSQNGTILKNSQASRKRERTIPSVVTTEIEAARKKRARNKFSFRSRPLSRLRLVRLGKRPG